MKLWIDDVRTPPPGYVWVRSTEDAIQIMFGVGQIELIDIDHDAGDYAQYGGDYIEVLKWLEETGRRYPIRIHSMNPVGVQNMRAIIEHNGWTEVK